MAVLAGNAADIYIATGSGTAMTGEAVTSLGGGVYQITDTAKRAINPNAAVTVLDGVSTVPKANYQIGWASGKITLTNGYTAGGTITITAEYLTLAQAAQAYEWSYDSEVITEESQTFGDTWKERTLVMKSGTISFQRFYDNAYFANTNLGSYYVLYLYTNLAGNDRFMAAGHMSSTGIASGKNELIKENVSFALHGEVDFSTT
jgi:hypothetical protein